MIGLVSLGNALAVPAFSNQNQYLAHVIGPRTPELSNDWLVGTTDPYPLFTRIVGVLFDLGGDTGLELVAYLATAAALTGVYLIARTLVGGRGVPIARGTRAGRDADPLDVGTDAGRKPVSLPRGLRTVSRLQARLPATEFGRSPVVAGAGTVGWEPDTSRPRIWAAAALMVLACAIHPTYAIVAGIGLTAALVADLITGGECGGSPDTPDRCGGVRGGRRSQRIPRSSPHPGGEALDRLAFERIAHHTLRLDVAMV